MTSVQMNHPPTTSEIKLQAVEDTSYTFKLSDFPFADADVGQVLKFVKFVGISERGKIFLNGEEIHSNQEISAEDIARGALTFLPKKDASGEDYSNFSFAVSDGIDYSQRQIGGFNISQVEDVPVLHSGVGYLKQRFEQDMIFVVNTQQLTDGSIAISTRKFEYGQDSNYYSLHVDKVQMNGNMQVTSRVDIKDQFINSYITSTVQLPDGKLLVAGNIYSSDAKSSQFFLKRFDSEGVLDKSFNQTGTVSAPLEHRPGNTQVLLQADGKYLVSTVEGADRDFFTFTLDRYLPDGRIDSEFNRFGATSSFLVGIEGIGKVVHVEPDGKILLLGQDYAKSGNVLVRLNTNGSLDQSFGTNGLVTVPIDQGNEFVRNLVVQKDGKVLLFTNKWGVGDNKINVVRLNTNGSYDLTFNGTGKLSLSEDTLGFHYGRIENVLIDDDQKLLIAGRSFQSSETDNPFTDQIFLLRLDNDGRVDKSFDTDGVVTLPLEKFGEKPTNIFVDQNGKIVVTISSYFNDQYSLITRYNNDGSVDRSFARPILSADNVSSGAQLDRNMWIDDPEITSGHSNKSILRISRGGGANDEDLFYFPSTFTFDLSTYRAYGGKIYRSETAIASYTSISGVLNVNFEASNSHNDILAVMRHVRYSNSQAGDERLVSLEWRFDEGIPGTVSVGKTYTDVLVLAASNSIPTASNFYSELNPLTNHIFTLDEFQFHDNDKGDHFQGIVIKSVSEYKELFLNNIEVKENQFISAEDIAKGLLRFRSLGESTAVFKFSVSDGHSTSIPYEWKANVFETIVIAPDKVSIGGTFTASEALRAVLNLNDIGDRNSLEYSWKIDGIANSQWNQSSLTPGNFDVGKKVELLVRYQDLNGNLQIYRAISDQVIVRPENYPPSGIPNISGRAYGGETLFYDGGIYDVDGIESSGGSPNFQFQWKADGVAIPNETTSRLFLSSQYYGKTIGLDISYRDLKGKNELVVWEKSFPINEVTVFSPSDKIKIAHPGDNKFVGSSGDDTVVFNHSIKNFLIMKRSIGESYLWKEGSANEIHELQNVEHVKFQDFSINFEIASKAKSIAPADLNRLVELYIAFFKRTPDADGLSYWIDQFKGGQSIEQIAKSFYDAGVQFSDLTGFSKTMSNEDFIHVVYRNTLGRQSGADADGLTYWSKQLDSGKSSYGSLVSEILTSAHNFKGNTDWGWVADLLDNKIAAASSVAIGWGLSFNTPEESITKGMQVIAAVTPTSSVWDAIKLIGINSENIVTIS